MFHGQIDTREGYFGFSPEVELAGAEEQISPSARSAMARFAQRGDTESPDAPPREFVRVLNADTNQGESRPLRDAAIRSQEGQGG